MASRKRSRRAPYASDPAREPRPAAIRSPPSADAQRLPARPRPHHPFDRVPPAQAQDAGVRLPRGRSFPHPADPHDRGGPDRPLARPRARPRRGPGRGAGARPRPRPHAVRPRRRGRARRMPGGVRRLRPQRPDAARRHRAGAALCRLRRAEPDLGDAGRPGQAQRPADRPRRRGRSARYAERGAAARRSPTIRRVHDLELWSYAERRGAGRGASPTTSPTTPTTSTTACAPGCSRSTTCADVPLVGDAPARDRRASIRGSSRAAASTNCAAALITRHGRGRDRARAARRIAELAPRSRRRCARRPARPLVALLAGDGRGRPRASRTSSIRGMYRHARVMRDHGPRPRRVVRDLFARYVDDAAPTCRREWRHGAAGDAGRPARCGRRLHRRHDRPLRARASTAGCLTVTPDLR